MTGGVLIAQLEAARTCLKFAAISVRCAKGQNQAARMVGLVDSTGEGIVDVSPDPKAECSTQKKFSSLDGNPGLDLVDPIGK
jgi:hypothetical protein